MKLVILFALIGAGFALVPGKEYLYDYEGRLGMGLPEIRNRVAGTGLRTKVIVQVQSEEDIVIKLSGVQVGDYLGDVKCDHRQPMPIHYKDIEGEGRLLEEPYKIHIHREQNDVMLVSKSDIEWITNIRKSIAGLFLIAPLRNAGAEVSRQKQQQQQMLNDVLQEPSIFGLCDADYTFVRLNESHHRQEQRVPDRHETWALTRHIKFDSCQESVVLQQTGFGNTSIARESQFGDVSSRVSRLSANLTYDGDRYTLNEAATEGYVVVNPFGLDHDKMMAIANQTIFLRSVEDIDKKLKVQEPSKSIKTWYQESASPFARSDSSPLWINFYDNNEDLYQPLVEESVATGIQIDQHLIQSFKEKLDDRLEDAAKILNRIPKPPKKHDISPLDSDLAVLPTLMEASFRLARALDQKATQELFDKYAKESDEKEQLKLRLYIDVLASAGTGAAMRVLVDEAIKGRITPERAASCFFTIPNTLVSSPVLPDLERYVKHVDLEKHPFATATVWINYANTLNRVCLNDRRYKYATPHELFGKKECNVKDQIESILPFYKEKLEKAKEDWQRIILVHAMGNLGTIQAQNHLIHVIKDRSQSDRVRVTAIYTLSRHKLPEGVKQQIFRTLRPIVEKRDENPYVRQACVIALLSWKPSPSFFQNLALLTWNDPSNNMASFVYSILRSYAESTDPHVDKQSKAAKFMLPLAKPYAPSLRHSDSHSYSKYTQQDQLATDFDVSWLKRDRLSKSFTEEVIAFLVNSYGGFRFSVAQSSVSYNHKAVSKLLREMSQILTQQLGKVRSSSNRRAQEDFIDLQGRMSQRNTDLSDYSIAFLSLFDNMEVLLPLSKEPLRRAFGQNGAQLFQRFLKDNKFHGTKFLNPGIIGVSLPSEIGLPVFVKTTMPTVNGGEANLVITADGEEVHDISQLLRAKNIKVKGDSNYMFTTKTSTMIRTVIPWSRKVAVVGVEALKAVNLPVQFQLTVSKAYPMKNISLDISPRHDAKDQEVTIVQAHTVPFVALKDMWPGEKPKDKQYQVVSLTGENKGTIERSKKLNENYSGLKGEARYEGDVASPFTPGHYMDLIRHPEEIPSLFSSPTSRMAEASVTVDFDKSHTKDIHSFLAFKVGHWERADEKQKQKEKQQQRDESSPSEPMATPELEIKSKLILSGSESRSYEASASVHRLGRNSDMGTVQVRLYQERSSLPHFDPEPKAHCLDMKVTGPIIDTLDDLRRTLRRDIVETDYAGQLKGGLHCQENIAIFAGKVRVSKERQERLKKEIDENCDNDPKNSLVYFDTAPVYDEAMVDIAYEDDQIPREIRNASYHIYDTIRGLAYPYVYFNYMDQKNTPGEITLVGRRYIGESRWEAEVKLPTETSKFDRLRLPSLVEDLVPIEGLRQSRTKLDTPSLVLEDHLSNECVITKSKVRAFDGYSYDRKLGSCSVKAVIDKEDREAPAVMVALDRDTDEPKAQIKSERPETSVQFTSTKLRVNNQEIHLTSQPKVIKVQDQYFGEALQTSSYIQVKVPGNFTVRVSDNKISITPSNNLRHRAGGLCGDLQAEHTEMVDEQNCIYKDSKLFAASWTESEAPGCNSQQVRQEKEAVQKYRQKCPKLRDEKWNTFALPKYSPVPEDCIEYVHKIKKTEDGALCVSQDVLPICYPLCKLDKPIVKEERYSCWSKEKAPKELSRNLKRGYLRHKLHRKPAFASSLRTEHANMCSRK